MQYSGAQRVTNNALIGDRIGWGGGVNCPNGLAVPKCHDQRTTFLLWLANAAANFVKNPTEPELKARQNDGIADPIDCDNIGNGDTDTAAVGRRAVAAKWLLRNHGSP